MFKLIKWLLALAFAGALLSAASYAAARFSVGQLLGPDPPLAGRTVEFALKGADELDDRPRVWVFAYGTSRLPGLRGAKVFVSPTGKIVATRPADLDRRIEVWERSKVP